MREFEGVPQRDISFRACARNALRGCKALATTSLLLRPAGLLMLITLQPCETAQHSCETAQHSCEKAQHSCETAQESCETAQQSCETTT